MTANPTAQLVSALEQASAKLSGAGYCPEQACAEAQTIIDAALAQSKAIEPSKDEDAEWLRELAANGKVAWPDDCARLERIASRLDEL